MRLTAFCDDYNEFRWFTSLCPEVRQAEFRRIESRGSNPGAIEQLIMFDRPDVILLIDEQPALVVEKTREVPTGHNVGQRMARLVRAVELGVPAIKFFPFDARKHGVHSGICNLNARLLLAFEKMWTIHETPILAVNWPADSQGELLDDARADKALSEIISTYLAGGLDLKSEVFSRARLAQREQYEQRCNTFSGYGGPPPSVSIENTQVALARLRVKPSSREEISLLSRRESVIYEIGMSESKCRREDPYTGTQFIYDYMYCRTGSDVATKDRNLFLHFPKIRKSVWARKNPNHPSRKSSNWYLTANALVFADGWTVLR